MDGKLIIPTDERTEACGFKVGDLVKAKYDTWTGYVIGFGTAWHKGCTIKVRLDGPVRGNMGDHHSVGNNWIEKVEQDT